MEVLSMNEDELKEAAKAVADAAAPDAEPETSDDEQGDTEQAEVNETPEPSEPSLAEELDQLQAAWAVERGELTSKLNIANERIEALEQAAEEREGVIERAEAEIEAAKAAAQDAKAKLSNPAFGDAVEGETEAAEVGDAPDAEGPGVLEQLLAITDPQAKTKFRKEHAEEIREAQQELAG